MTVHVSVPLDEADLAELTKIAARENAPIERIIARLVRQRVGHESWLKTEIQKGIDSAANEPLADHDDILTALEQRMAAAPKAK